MKAVLEIEESEFCESLARVRIFRFVRRIDIVELSIPLSFYKTAPDIKLPRKTVDKSADDIFPEQISDLIVTSMKRIFNSQ